MQRFVIIPYQWQEKKKILREFSKIHRRQKTFVNSIKAFELKTYLLLYFSFQ